MKSPFLTNFLAFAFAITWFAAQPEQALANEAVARHGMVASAHRLATEAGVDVLRRGGNAIDAAVAVGLTLSVVDSHNSGVGGGCFMMIRLANGDFCLIDGREKAPAAINRETYLRNGAADTSLSQTGALASGVPGEVAAFEYALDHFGTLDFDVLCSYGERISREGFPLNRIFASRLASTADSLRLFEASRQVYFRNGKPLARGELLMQPDLAKSFAALGKGGSDWFYRGEFAQMTAAWMKSNGGVMTAEDFADYRVEIREPIRTSFRGYEIVSFPPPSSGGVHIAHMLQVLDRYPLETMDEAMRLHLIAESMKLAFSDRAFWLGDPKFTKVPKNLVSADYAKERAGLIDLAKTSNSVVHGTPAMATTEVFAGQGEDKHTTHFSVADSFGNWVACTATVNTGFGSKVIIPGTGIVMNNEMDDFSLQPNVANYFGLVGSEANSVQPGKRPLSSMSPTIVLQNGQPILAIGAAGGPRIITCVLQELVSMLALKQTPAQAIAMPRIHHQWSPNELMIEKELPSFLQVSLRAKGHNVSVLTSSSNSHFVWKDTEQNLFVGAADPRGDGTAAGLDRDKE